MARTTADWYDFVLAGVYALAIAVTVGIAQVQLFDTSFSDNLFTVFGNSSITVATALSLSALGITYVTNENGRNISDLDDIYRVALIATVGLTVAIPLVPAVENFVTSSDFIRSLVVGISSIGFAAVGYIK